MQIRELLRNKFGVNKVVTDAMDPDLAVAAGAAVMAAQLEGAMPQQISLMDAVPHDLGVLINERLVIPRLNSYRFTRYTILGYVSPKEG